MKVTVAMDNTVPFNDRRPLVAEHGVSYVVDVGGKSILYDVGQTGAVVDNLMALGISPASLDGIALSHGHYDHTGGLLAVLGVVRKDIPIFVHAHAFTERYSVTPRQRSPIGIPFAEDFIRSRGGNWRLLDEPAEIVPGLWFSGTIPRITDFEPGDKRLVVSSGTEDHPDPMEDDTVLYHVDARGLVVIGGCTHSGLVNAVLHGFTLTGAKRLQGWVGGTHLGPVGREQQDRTIAQLRDWNPDVVATGHCSGFAVMTRLAGEFGERFIPAFVGRKIVFGEP